MLKSLALFPLALACALAVAGCGLGGGDPATEAPPPVVPPARAPAPPVAADDADVPKKDAKPLPPLLPDGSRSKFLPRTKQRQAVKDFFMARRFCRRKRDAQGRVWARAGIIGVDAANATIPKEEGRLRQPFVKAVDALDRLLETFKQNPRAAVVTDRAPHTLFELMEMMAAAIGRDCEIEDGPRKLERDVRKYARKYLD